MFKWKLFPPLYAKLNNLAAGDTPDQLKKSYSCGKRYGIVSGPTLIVS